MKRMLINATQREELRVALVDGQYLYDLDIETPSREQKKANIYKGKITRVEPSLEAAFVDYGAERHGFLPLKEISPQYFKKQPAENERINIRDVVDEGQEILVQVDKEERGTKGAALTTFISLAGRYLVLMPNNPRAGGVSRRIEGDDRSELREAMATLQVPEGMGIIARTAGVGRTAEELQWDLDYLMRLWQAVEVAANERPASFLVYQESNIIIRAIRDYFRQDIGEVLIDNEDVYAKAAEFMQQVMPQNLSKMKLYKDPVPLFSRFQIETQIESAFLHSVRLPSGGSIVIDHTEALVSVDINSSRATQGGDIEETALNTNLEAADEIARQLRLRDIGGLIVIDFIDMTPVKNQRAVEDRLRDALHNDRARVQVGRISRFGLLEMSRQRLRPALGESIQMPCPRCEGEGRIRSIESLGLSILRILEEEALKEKTHQIQAQVPVDVATFILNEKRAQLLAVEQRHQTHVILIPNPAMQTPNYEIKRIRLSEAPLHSQPSYKQVTPAVEAIVPYTTTTKYVEEPVVRQVSPATPAPAPTAPRPEERPRAAAAPLAVGGGFIKRLWSSLFPGTEKEVETATTPVRGQAPREMREEPQRVNGDRGKGRGGRGQRGRRGGRSRREGEAGQSSVPRQHTRDSAPTAGEPRADREPRETREPREAREPREPRPQGQQGQGQSRGEGGGHRDGRGPRHHDRRPRRDDRPRERPEASAGGESSAPSTPAAAAPAAPPAERSAPPPPAAAPATSSDAPQERRNDAPAAATVESRVES